MPRKPKHTFNGDADAALRYKLHVWGHNALLGGLRICIGHLDRYKNSNSVGPHAKELAVSIQHAIRTLIEVSNPRLDPPELFGESQSTKTWKDEIPF